jgi:hypothetical protein
MKVNPRSVLTERDERFLRYFPWYLGAVTFALVGVAIYEIEAGSILYALALFSCAIPMGYSSLYGFTVRDLILAEHSDPNHGQRASDRDEALAYRRFRSSRMVRFSPFVTAATAATALILLFVAVASATGDRSAAFAAFCFVGAAVFILLTLFGPRFAWWMASRR